MKRYDLVVIGAGPAGLCAAVEGAKKGMSTVVFDENAKPGGQLFKQIHKFFGSKEHKAKVRGINIGKKLLEEARDCGVEVNLNSPVIGIFPEKTVSVMKEDHIETCKANSIVVATGASERMIPFEGWTIPGVIGAGAAQTMVNLHGVCPGKRILMVGSGNVGLVVGFQLLQAGCELVGVVDAAPRIGGYGVHASKLSRTGVNFYLSHTIVKAEGTDKVTGVTIGEVDKTWNIIPGTEKHFDIDTICVAVGLNPMSQLVRMTGVKMEDRGGLVPVCDKYGCTSIPGIFAAGDVAGIEEASSAMINGHIAGLAAAKYGKYIEEKEFEQEYIKYSNSIEQLRQGMFSRENRGRTDLAQTDEGYGISQSLLKNGYIDETEIDQYPGVTKKFGIHPVIECTQNIPCNPCQDACKFGCIKIGDKITALPAVDDDKDCRNCGMCVASCSGQAIFLVDDDCGDGFATVTLPYEFLPLPSVGDMGNALDRRGKVVGEAEVIDIKTSEAFDKTVLLTIKVPKELSGSARFFKK